MSNFNSFALARNLFRRFDSRSLASLPAAISLVLLILCAQRISAQETDWASLLGAKGNEVGYSVATDYDGSVVVVGSFEGATNIGGASLASAGQTDVFVARFSSTSALLWA